MSNLSLSKTGTINLSKNSTISLVKEETNQHLVNATVGLGWDPADRKSEKRGLMSLFGSSSPKEIDLDASIIAYNSAKSVQEIVYYGKLKSKNKSIIHHGDNLTGHGDGDDEQISIDLSRVDASTHYLAVVINSYSGDKFRNIENVFCRIVDGSNGQEVVHYDMQDRGGDNTALLIGIFSRMPSGGWDFTAVSAPMTGRTASDIKVNVANHL